jgi:hypothetical protein
LNAIDDCQDRLHRAGWSVGDRQVTTKQGDAWEVTCTHGGREIQVMAPTRPEAWELACSQAAKPALPLGTYKASLASKITFAIALGVVAMPLLCCGSVVLFAIIDNLENAGRVWVHVENLSPGTTFWSVASEQDGMLRSMNWYRGRSLTGGQKHPATGGWSYPGLSETHAKGQVVWQEGERYGVVTRNKDNVWLITWFGPDVHKPDEVKLNLSQGVPTPLTPQQLKELGLDKVRPYGE